MRTIPLTKGKYAVVDDGDYNWLAVRRWTASDRGNGRWYATSSINGRGVYMHRLIFGAKSEERVDHRDRDGLNNQRSNLRSCTQTQNLANSRERRHSSVFRGVYRCARRKTPWAAIIRVNRKGIALGRHKTEIEAARAYDAAAMRYFGEFARLNLKHGLK